MTSKTIWTLIIVVAVIGLLVWYKIHSNAEAASKLVQPATKGQPLLVSGYVVALQSVDNKVVATGSIMANEEVELKSESAGKITGLYLKEGSRVRKGELLVKINDSDLRAQLRKAESIVKLDEETEAREKKLLDINGISKEEYDISSNTLEGAKADVALIKAQIEKTEIRAPFDGTVGLKNVSTGSYISNATTVAFIEELDPVKIDFSIPEKYMKQVKVGDSIIFNVASTVDKYTGIIYAIEPRIDMASRTLQIRAHASNREGKLLSGAFASVQLLLEHRDNIIMVPTQALIPALKSQKVFVSVNGKAQARTVETGIRTDAAIEITKGLQAGDTVITTGIMQLKQDALIQITDITKE